MATLLDGQYGMKKETTYGTPVTVDRFYEVLADSSHNFDKMPIRGEGLKVGSNGPRVDRSVAGVGKGTITVKANILSKTFGVLLEAISGTAVSTLVSASTYQQRGIATTTTPYARPSYTIQFGVPRSDASGTVDAYTYAGCVATAFEIDAPARSAPTLSVTFWAKSLATATALATASYATSATMFTDSASTAGATFGGALTMPTTTALVSGGTAASNIRSWTFTGDLGVNERPALGSWQQPTFGKASYSLKFAQDYDATTTRALQLAETSTSFTGYFTGAALSTGTERFELAIPAMLLDDGSLGQVTAGDGSIPEPSFTVAENGTDPMWALVFRTADTAL